MPAFFETSQRNARGPARANKGLKVCNVLQSFKAVARGISQPMAMLCVALCVEWLRLSRYARQRDGGPDNAACVSWKRRAGNEQLDARKMLVCWRRQERRRLQGREEDAEVVKKINAVTCVCVWWYW